jgi:hypothetical protein
MEQPEGFAVEGQEKLVCKLIKALYGLKQAPRAWYDKFNKDFHLRGYLKEASMILIYISKKKMEKLLLWLSMSMI